MVFASLANGNSKAYNLLRSEDVMAINVVKNLELKFIYMLINVQFMVKLMDIKKTL